MLISDYFDPSWIPASDWIAVASASAAVAIFVAAAVVVGRWLAQRFHMRILAIVVALTTMILGLLVAAEVFVGCNTQLVARTVSGTWFHHFPESVDSYFTSMASARARRLLWRYGEARAITASLWVLGLVAVVYPVLVVGKPSVRPN